MRILNDRDHTTTVNFRLSVFSGDDTATGD